MSLSVFGHFKLSSRGENIGGVRLVRILAKNAHTDESMQLEYIKQKTVGTGTFGTVIQVKLVSDNNEIVAIKEVLQDKRYRNRELEILRTLDHPNVCHLRSYFYRYEEDKKFVTKRTKKTKDKTYLNLVIDFMPETMYSICQLYTKSKQRIPSLTIKLYLYQLFRALAYCHQLGICHRDLKPQNLLVDPHTGVLKLCDFGSAKRLVSGEPNVAYICSRYYRAPELIFGATSYTTSIDIWSVGCIMGEMLSGRILFSGKSSMDQLVEIIKVLGTPTAHQITKMNPSHITRKLPQIEPKALSKVIGIPTSQETLDLMAKLLKYAPDKRITAIEAMTHPYFDELRSSPLTTTSSSASSFSASTTSSITPPSLTTTTSSLSSRTFRKDTPWPALFDFTTEELMIRPDLKSKLLPSLTS
ncbi:putative glycogen synthase kinase 3 alpha [Chlamydoabsidia padenii]|nr:putative glycogen synthase kinase 3 alpha [Chlamydoabsidia padenii]